eukprot:2193908-Prorocentrum_lima.AAC.1
MGRPLCGRCADTTSRAPPPSPRRAATQHDPRQTRETLSAAHPARESAVPVSYTHLRAHETRRHL